MLAEERAERKASFCLVTGIAPSEYEALTWFEIEAFAQVVQDRDRR